MGKIKGLQRGYAASYCKNVKDCIALACTDGSIPISYTLFIKLSLLQFGVKNPPLICFVFVIIICPLSLKTLLFSVGVSHFY